MENATIRSAVLDLVRQGRLTADDGQVHLDGEPLYKAAGEEAEAGEYREDGYSIETSHGCRRHRAIDQFLEELARGDEYEKRVAAEADLLFGFHPDEVPHLAPDDEAELSELAHAYSNSNLIIRLLGGGVNDDVLGDFRIKPGDKYDADGYWYMPERHAIVYAKSPEAEVASRWPETYIQRLKSRVAALRRQAGLDWK